MQDIVIGMDIGTGSTKAVALDKHMQVVAVTQSFYNTSSARPGYAEQDPEVIWNAFTNCLQEIVKKIKAASFSVSISSAMHSLIVVNKNNIPLTPVITWEDTRSDKIAEKLRKSEDGESIYRSTGTPIHSMTPLCKIKWLQENGKEIFAKSFKYISIKEFIWFRLFNTYEVDYSIASATGLFNITTLTWNAPSLQFCGIEESQLSKPVNTNFRRNQINPEIARTLQIEANTEFCIGASDGCLANLGSDATREGTAALTIGTSGAVRIAGARPVINFSAMIFNYLLDDTTFIIGGPINNGGNILKWMFKTFLQNSNPSDIDYSNIFSAIEKIQAGSNGLIFLPYIYGERAPIWDEKTSGVFFGIQSFHTHAHFFRAALEGICYALKEIMEIIESSASPIQQLSISGGFVHSLVWTEILADITEKELYLVQSEDASSIGAAVIGMKAMSIIGNYDELGSETKEKIKPNLQNREIYNRSFNIYKTLYKSLKEPMHLLRQKEL
jgi:gluconokinase